MLLPTTVSSSALVPTGQGSLMITAVIHRATLPGPTMTVKVSLLCFVTLPNCKQLTQQLAKGR